MILLDSTQIACNICVGWMDKERHHSMIPRLPDYPRFEADKQSIPDEGLSSMKTLMMSLVLVMATACTTVATTSSVAKDEAGEAKKSEEGLRQERQQALLEALDGKSSN